MLYSCQQRREFDDSCRLNEILEKQNEELKNSKELLVKDNYNLKITELTILKN